MPTAAPRGIFSGSAFRRDLRVSAESPWSSAGSFIWRVPTGSIGSKAPSVSTRPPDPHFRAFEPTTSGVEPTHRTCRTASPETKSGLSVAPALQLLQLWSQQRPPWPARGHPRSGGTVVRVPQLCRQGAAHDRLRIGEAGVLPVNRRGRESGDGRHLPETCNDLR